MERNLTKKIHTYVYELIYYIPGTNSIVNQLSFNLFIYLFIYFLGLHLRHMEVPSLGAELQL